MAKRLRSIAPKPIYVEEIEQQEDETLVEEQEDIVEEEEELPEEIVEEEPVVEVKKPLLNEYHTVFVYKNDEWYHHSDNETRQEAEDQRKKLYEEGEKSIRIIVPAKDIHWDDTDISKYVEKRLGRS